MTGWFRSQNEYLSQIETKVNLVFSESERISLFFRLAYGLREGELRFTSSILFGVLIMSRLNTSRLISCRRLLGVVSLFVLGIGLPHAAFAAPQDPFDPVADELVRIYVDELTNCDCDYLVVAVLEGAPSSEKSKEGVVVSMFPPTNDGTSKNNDPIPGIDIIVEKDPEDNPRPSPSFDIGSLLFGDTKSGSVDHNTTRSNRDGIRDTGGGLGSGDAKSGAISHNNVRSNRGSKTDTGGGLGSGDTKSGAINHNNVRSNRGTKADTGGGTGSGDTKSGAVNHNSSRSNKGTTTDTGGENDHRFWKSRSARLGDSGDESNVVQCEHCGASCTERCRCQPTGLDLIFGHTDDRLVAMESDADGTYLAFETCYGMRSVTLTSMGKDLNLTLVIAKGWRAESLNR